MTHFSKFAVAAVLAAMPFATLAAQETPLTMEFQLGLVVGTGNDFKTMSDGTAWSAGVTLPIELSEGFFIRPHLTAIMFDGIEGSGLTAKRPNIALGLDAKILLGNKVSLFGGPFGMKWNQSIGMANDPRFSVWPDESGAVIGSLLNTSVKFGGRVGLDYEINDKFVVQVMWTVAEANRRFTPSWITIGGAVRF